MHDELHLLARVLDVDEPVVIRMRHEPDPASARLLVTLGAGWVVDERAPVCARRCGRAECKVSDEPRVVVRRRSSRTLGMGEMVGAQAQPASAWKPDWISYRSSVANVDRRADRGDVAITCEECGCEIDVDPPPHSPRCPVVAAREWTREAMLDAIRAHDARAGEPPYMLDWGASTDEHPSAVEINKEFGGWNAAIEEAGFEARRKRRPTARTTGEVDGLELLERMDAGEPIAPGPAQPAPTPEGERDRDKDAGSRASTTTTERTIMECKIEGCDGDASAAPRAGIKARLCARHRDEAGQRQSERLKGRPRGGRSGRTARTPSPPRVQPQPAPVPAAANGTYVSKAERLLAAARAVDEAEATLELAHAELKQATEALA